MKKKKEEEEKKNELEQKENKQLMADDSRGFLWGSFDRTTKEWNNNKKGFQPIDAHLFFVWSPLNINLVEK